jgi:hypothetical protein
VTRSITCSLPPPPPPTTDRALRELARNELAILEVEPSTAASSAGAEDLHRLPICADVVKRRS